MTARELIQEKVGPLTPPMDAAFLVIDGLLAQIAGLEEELARKGEIVTVLAAERDGQRDAAIKEFNLRKAADTQRELWRDDALRNAQNVVFWEQKFEDSNRQLAAANAARESAERESALNAEMYATGYDIEIEARVAAEKAYTEECLKARQAERERDELKVPAVEFINIVFDGPPSHESGRFVEVEDDAGRGMRVGEWVEAAPYWKLRIPTLRAEITRLSGVTGCCAECESKAREIERLKESLASWCESYGTGREFPFVKDCPRCPADEDERYRERLDGYMRSGMNSLREALDAMAEIDAHVAERRAKREGGA